MSKTTLPSISLTNPLSNDTMDLAQQEQEEGGEEEEKRGTTDSID